VLITQRRNDRAMTKRVFYLMSGSAHCPYLVTSLHSLRNTAHFTGEVEVYAWPDSIELVSRIAEDLELGIRVIEREPEYRGKNSQFLDKIRLAQSMEDGVNLYLDADTMPVQELDVLFAEAENSFVATQFGNWVSNEGMPRKRVNRLTEYFESDWLDAALMHPFPSPNGGVFAFTEQAGDLLAYWEQWTNRVKKNIFIADEACLHVMVAAFLGKGLWCSPGCWNSSPKHKVCSDEEVKIWHFHGDSNVRRKDGKFKSQKGYDVWWPVFQECLDQNVGGVAEWCKSAGNSDINYLLGGKQ